MSSASSPKLGALGVSACKSVAVFPPRSTACNSALGGVPRLSTRASPSARFTSALSTPCAFCNAVSTRLTQDAQVMPLIESRVVTGSAGLLTACSASTRAALLTLSATVTSARRVAKLTWAVTPSSAFKALSARTAQDAQLRPWTGKLSDVLMIRAPFRGRARRVRCGLKYHRQHQNGCDQTQRHSAHSKAYWRRHGFGV